LSFEQAFCILAHSEMGCALFLLRSPLLRKAALDERSSRMYDKADSIEQRLSNSSGLLGFSPTGKAKPSILPMKLLLDCNA
jgi:hypothetical protein